MGKVIAKYICIFCSCSGLMGHAFGGIHWISDMEVAKREAFTNEKLILLVEESQSDFIENDAILSGKILEKLVPVLGEGKDGISFLDMNGNVLISDVGVSKLAEIISTIPGNFNQLNLDLDDYNKYGKSTQRSYDLAKSYQELAMNWPEAYISEVIHLSNSYFKEAATMGKKEKDTNLSQSALLELGANYLLQDKYDEAINSVMKDVGINHLELSNMALAYYVLAVSNEMSGDEKKAQLYSDKLLLVPGGYEYMVKLKGRRSAPSSY